MKNSTLFYTVPEAAKKFGVNRKTMSRWVKSGKIKSIVTPGGHYRIPQTEISRLLEKAEYNIGKSKGDNEGIILIVDDDPSVRTTLKTRLDRENFQVVTSSNGFDAGLKSRDIKPDLIILDLMMDGMDGFEVCKVIKADNSLERTKIIIMSGFDSPENRQQALEVGADSFLSKNNSFETILNQIKDLIN